MHHSNFGSCDYFFAQSYEAHNVLYTEPNQCLFFECFSNVGAWQCDVRKVAARREEQAADLGKREHMKVEQACKGFKEEPFQPEQNAELQ